MNTKNNQRHQNTIAAIEAAFISLLKEKRFSDITVQDNNESVSESQTESITKKIVTTIAEVVSDIQPTEKETE